MEKTIKIAIAEDEGLVRSGFGAVLKEVENFEVILNASNGKELIDSLEKVSDLPDIILKDLNILAQVSWLLVHICRYSSH